MFEELAEYLGTTPEQCVKSWEDLQKLYRNEWDSRATEAGYYKDTLFYLYDLSVWEADPARKNFNDRIVRFLIEKKAKKCCDFGSGIGGDALLMLNRGAEFVYMVDYPSRTNDYAQWRLKKRGLWEKTLFVPLKEDGMPVSDLPEKVDYITSIASLEHCPDPKASIDWMRRNGSYLLLRPDPSNKDAHPMHHEEHFNFLSQMMSKRPGDKVHGLQILDIDDDPTLYLSIEN